MGNRERDKGKQKRPEYEGYGDSSEVSARRTRARLTSGLGGRNGAGVNSSLPPLELRDDRSRNRNWPRSQQQPAAQGGGEQGGSGGLRTVDLISQIDRPPQLSDPEVMGSFQAPSSAAQHQESGGVGNLGTLMPPACAGRPSSSSQMNIARDSTRQQSYTTEVQPAANMAPQPCPQAPPSSQAQRSGRRGLLVQARAPATAGQHAAAKEASGSGQPQPRANASSVVRCPACNNNPLVDRCLLCGSEPLPVPVPVPVNLALAIDPRQRQPPPPPQQGLPAAPTSHTTLAPLPQQLGGSNFGTWKPPAPGLEGQAQPSAGVGQHHFLQAPEQEMCPGCGNSPRLIVMYPVWHLCLCAFCRVCLGCSICVYATPGTQPPSQG